ncbi:hypothetical protein [Allorhizocola rhizosphaerae]|uniref:hypothetical protein n=1 Tax=Allorhizocola rhizosphaerae TaxID=1872709 RepID=UPI000E3E979E|nr:hypothetical protein [Allorhizocola rhizosphaerae]
MVLDAQLGIFIHYEIYAVGRIAESWAFYSRDVPHEQCMTQLNGFSAANADPRVWAALFLRAAAGAHPRFRPRGFVPLRDGIH